MDDEVRDRAAIYLKVLQRTELADVYVKAGEMNVYVNGSMLLLNIHHRIYVLAHELGD